MNEKVFQNIETLVHPQNPFLVGRIDKNEVEIEDVLIKRKDHIRVLTYNLMLIPKPVSSLYNASFQDERLEDFV